MTFVEHAPYLRSKTERVGKHLKYDVAFCGAIPEPTQRSKTEGVSRVVREIESTLERICGALGIEKPHLAGTDQSRRFCFVRCFLAERPRVTTQILKGGDQNRLR